MNDKSLRISATTDIMLNGIAEHDETTKKQVVRQLVRRRFATMPDEIKQRFTPIAMDSDFISSPSMTSQMSRSAKGKTEREALS